LSTNYDTQAGQMTERPAPIAGGRSENTGGLPNVIYNETPAFSPVAGAGAGEPGSAEDLHKGRVAFGEIL